MAGIRSTSDGLIMDPSPWICASKKGRGIPDILFQDPTTLLLLCRKLIRIPPPALFIGLINFFLPAKTFRLIGVDIPLSDNFL
jgi:hypothetical protein